MTLERLDPARHTWMKEPATLAVMDALGTGDAPRFVGGAVRSALLGAKVDDIDIATPLVPEEVIARLEKAGIQAVPTGIEHGTVTAVANGKPFEVTTLRRDVATDGRRAVVAYTKDWAEDAARRDFTMNALYASRDGALFDPTGGLKDLKAGRVRFVGDPASRIREDYLRILRLFRFQAWYGKGALEEAALHAAAREKAGLKTLSGERIQKEMLKLLASEDPAPVLADMEKAGILAEIFTKTAPISHVGGLAKLDRENKFPPAPVVRLAALLSGIDAAKAAAERLRLSNADRERLIAARTPYKHISAWLSDDAAKAVLYRVGAEDFRDHVMLRWAVEHAMPTAPRWRAFERLSKEWVRPQFPLNGKDAMEAGLVQGPKLGAALKEVEDWWSANAFKPSRAELLSLLSDVAKRSP